MSGLIHLLLPDVKQILAEGDHQALGEALSDLHAADVAELLAELEDSDRAVLFQQLSEPVRHEVFEHIEEDVQLELLAALGPAVLSPTLDEMAPDDRADFVKALPERTRNALLLYLSREEAEDVRELIAYDEGTAGAVMTSEFAAVPPFLTIDEALQALRRVARSRETIYYVYVVDDDGRLLGTLTLEELVLADPQSPVESIMTRELIWAHVNDDQEEVARTIAKYDFLALPILDERDRLVGIVTHDDVLDIIEEEQTEDAQRMGAIEPLDVPYVRAGFWQLVRKRGLWLSLLFFAELGTCQALDVWEGLLRHPGLLLVLFIPLVLSSGGNTGSQSATLIIRSLSIGELQHSSWRRVILREIAMGLTLGTFLGLIAAPVSWLWTQDPRQSAVVGLTVVSVMTTGALIGTIIPLGLSRLGLDPALMSNPFIASLSDVCGILVFLSMAKIVLGL